MIHTEAYGNRHFRGTMKVLLRGEQDQEFVLGFVFRRIEGQSPSHLVITQVGRALYRYHNIHDANRNLSYTGMKQAILMLFIRYTLRGIIELRVRQPGAGHHKCGITRIDAMAGEWTVGDGILDQVVELDETPMVVYAAVMAQRAA
ncbi:MAG: hypothetical protein WC734_04225 [Patescibacteria group bacterium]